jgi:putative aldouronate transport system permease protein
MAKFDTRGDKGLVVLNYVLLGLLTLVMLYPFWEQLIMSMSPREEALLSGAHLLTLRPTLNGYQKVLTTPAIMRAFRNSVVRVALGTVIAVFFTSLCAYPLSKKYFPLRRTFTALILFTMMFSGGIIPSYMLIRSLGLYNTMWALVLPGAVSAYNLIIMRNFLMSLPESLEESARIDGATELQVWWSIVLPLSLPVMATVALWVAVGHWNAYFDALIYLTDQARIVLQVILRRILLEDSMDYVVGGPTEVPGQSRPTGEVVKAAIIMLSTLPIILIYPFLQRYFVRGIILGGVKG